MARKRLHRVFGMGFEKETLVGTFCLSFSLLSVIRVVSDCDKIAK